MDAPLRWRARLTLEVLLVLLALAMGVVAFYQLQRTTNLRQERATVEDQLFELRSRLNSPQGREELQELRQAFEQLQGDLAGQRSTTRQEALRVGADLAAYAAQRGLRVLAFKSRVGFAPTGTDQYANVDMSLEVEGSITNLIGMLGIVDAFPEARVETFTFTRAQTGADLWVASVILKAPYPGEAQRWQ